MNNEQFKLSKLTIKYFLMLFLSLMYYISGTIPCFALGAQISPLPLICSILATAGGFNQTPFLTLQGILHGSPTLRALS